MKTFVRSTATWYLCLAHLRPGDDDPDEADVVRAHAVQALVDALREELTTVVARLDEGIVGDECKTGDYLGTLKQIFFGTEHCFITNTDITCNHTIHDMTHT